MSGLIDLIRKDHFPRGANVLFLHTGGSPALICLIATVPRLSFPGRVCTLPRSRRRIFSQSPSGGFLCYAP